MSNYVAWPADADTAVLTVFRVHLRVAGFRPFFLR